MFTFLREALYYTLQVDTRTLRYLVTVKMFGQEVRREYY
jgi:hypothetical protein